MAQLNMLARILNVIPKKNLKDRKSPFCEGSASFKPQKLLPLSSQRHVEKPIRLTAFLEVKHGLFDLRATIQKDALTFFYSRG